MRKETHVVKRTASANNALRWSAEIPC